MTTIINTPAPTESSNSSGLLIGGFLLLVFVGIALYFGIPAIKRMGSVQLNVPAPQVVIPEKIDVNVTNDE